MKGNVQEASLYLVYLDCFPSCCRGRLGFILEDETSVIVYESPVNGSYAEAGLRPTDDIEEGGPPIRSHSPASTFRTTTR